MAQQTAVEWLFDEIPLEWIIKRSAFDALQQAKAMEKEQMIEFFMKGQNTYPSEFVLDNKQIAEQYYNETFKK
jgi:hypothetical protein